MRLTVALLVALISSCNSLPLDSGAFAAVAGQSTIALGACGSQFNLGWQECLVEKSAAPLPSLSFVMTNPGEWAVSDCTNGIFKSGATSAAGLVTVDLADLQAQIVQNGICILKIETAEHYPDPKDPKQMHTIPMRGGFFVEAVDPGYFPTPDKPMIAFCTQVERTTTGRTIVKSCTPQ